MNPTVATRVSWPAIHNAAGTAIVNTSPPITLRDTIVSHGATESPSTGVSSTSQNHHRAAVGVPVHESHASAGSSMSAATSVSSANNVARTVTLVTSNCERDNGCARSVVSVRCAYSWPTE
jgi:hypothetical protein